PFPTRRSSDLHGRGLGQLQRRGYPVALADGGIDGVAGVPGLVEAAPLPLARGADAGDLADQVDAGRVAEAELVEPGVHAVHAHLHRQLEVIAVDRLRQRFAQVDPAVAAAAPV